MGGVWVNEKEMSIKEIEDKVEKRLQFVKCRQKTIDAIQKYQDSLNPRIVDTRKIAMQELGTRLDSIEMHQREIAEEMKGARIVIKQVKKVFGV